MHLTPRTSRRRGANAAAALSVVVTAALLGAPSASAAPAPASTLPGVAGLLDAGGPAGLPATVTSAPLPTVQVDGVVWAQAVVGNTVYVTGEFTSARPAGAPRGTGEVKRSNALAYDVRTGTLLPWAPSLNAQGLAVAASPDGRRVYLGGDFTTVDGQNRYRIAALDAATGALDPSFAPGVNARVRSIVAVGTTVYAGGVFSQAGSFQRAHLAAFAAADGAVTTWAPGASIAPGDLKHDDPQRPATPEVLAMTAPDGTGTLVVGGRFTRLGGTAAYGIGSLDLSTGAVRPFAADSVVRNAGQGAAITTLASQGGTVYGAGYDFYSAGDGNLEGSFAADATSGALSWVDGCMGDTYSVAPAGPVLYRVGHSHDCSVVGGHPEKNPRDYQRAIATTSAPSPLGRTDHAGPFVGRPSSETLHWLPQVSAGTYTGQNQGGWSVLAAGNYVVMAGEFPSVNGVPQQGLVRFAAGRTAPAATDADKPIGYSTLAPAAATVQPGRVRLGWQAAWDRDSAGLTYELLRGSTVVSTQVVPSAFWDLPRLSAVDAAAPAGQSSYRVRVTDGSGRSMTSQATVVDVPAGTTPAAPATAVTQAVDADAPLHHWRLGEAAGGPLAAAGLDRAGSTDLTLPASAVRGVPGASADGDTATTFASGEATTTALEQGAQSFSQELWLRTTTRTGGKLIGFESSPTGSSARYDRQLWMGNDGRVSFGVADPNLKVVRTPTALNDGAWHQVVATLNGGTAELFVDGAQVASLDGVRQASAFDGYWRVGGGRLTSWPNVPTTTSFAGDLDDVAVYRVPLSAARVAAHQAAAGVAGPVVPPPAPPAPPVPPTDPAPPAPVDPPAPPAGPAPVGTTLVADDFSRTVASGLGSATTGGAWSTTPTSAFSVAGGAGSVSVAPGRSAEARVGPATTGVDVRATVLLTKPSATDTALFSVVGRSVGTADDYRLKVRSASDGTVDLAVVATTGGTERTVKRVFLARSAADPSGPLSVRLQVVPEGTSTRLRASVWSGAVQPAGWQVDAVDATAALQSPGTVGIGAYLSTSAPTGRLVVAIDDLSVTVAR